MSKEKKTRINGNHLVSAFLIITFVGLSLLLLKNVALAPKVRPSANVAKNPDKSNALIETLRRAVRDQKKAKSSALDREWQIKFDELKQPNRRPLRVRITTDYANKGWFGFFTRTDAFDHCAVPCKAYTDDQGIDFPTHQYDAIITHNSQCKKENFGPEILATKPLESDRRYLTIHANLHNEAPAVNFRECSEVQGGSDQMQSSPVDVSVSFFTNSTINSNYFYTKPTSFVYKSKTPAEEEEMFQGMCAFVSNCVEHRVEFIQKLSKHVPLKSYGRCLNNADAPNSAEAKMQTIKKCKFYLAFENTLLDDYVTEKFYQGWMLDAPTLMVYSGAPNIVDVYSPTNPGENPAFINARDFKDADELGKYMASLLKDKKAYEKYFEWRKTGDPDKDYSKGFMATYSRRVINMCCKVCTAAGEMQLARKILSSYGFEPPANQYKISLQNFKTMLSAKITNVNSHAQFLKLYDIAYGRYWNKDNHLTPWNDIHYTTSKNWVEFKNNDW
ncbi:alpha-(1,3)-fucosyltransferase [Acrasis kona]|uniref:Fucosyltransferase n=1 Tax=Acrasis kona TaxID=1008807 RepID=A0AAW2Z764_9EUKA